MPSRTARATVELVDARLGEEAEAAEVDAEDRDVAAGLRDARRHAEQRAVAAEDDDQIDVRRAARRASRSARRAASPASVAVSVSKTGSMLRSRSHVARRARWSAAATRPRLATMPTRVDACAGVMTRGGDSRNSTLPFWPVMGEGVEATRRQSYLSGRGRDFVEHARVDRRVADDAFAHFAAAGLELRLDQRHDVGAWLQQRRDDRQDVPQRDERHVDGDEVDRCRADRRASGGAR